MDRRTLIRLSVAGAAAGIIAPKAVLANDRFNALTSPFAGSLYYTADAPGRWSKKAAGHLPNIERSGELLQITTRHEMDGFRHYIVKHQIFDENMQFVAETNFDPETTKEPISVHDVSGLQHVVYAFSQCNQHDGWLNLIEI